MEICVGQSKVKYPAMSPQLWAHNEKYRHLVFGGSGGATTICMLQNISVLHQDDAHLACFKPGQMCITLKQRPDIQQLSHHLCTATSKTTHHEPSHQGGDGCGRYLSMPQLPAMVRNAKACASIGRQYKDLYH